MSCYLDEAYSSAELECETFYHTFLKEKDVKKISSNIVEIDMYGRQPQEISSFLKKMHFTKVSASVENSVYRKNDYSVEAVVQNTENYEKIVVEFY